MNRSERTTRIIAVVLAIFVWTYVRIGQQSTETQRVIHDLPVKVQYAPNWTGRLRSGDNTVDITIKGPADRVNNLARDEIEARLDLTRITDQRSVRRRVSVDLPNGVQPAKTLPEVTVFTVPLERKSFPVDMSFITAPPSGTTVGEYLMQPDTVAVEGPRDALDQVKYVTVRIDPSESMSTGVDLVPRAVNADGERVDDVVVLRSVVNVSMASLTGEQTTRQVAVRAPELQHLPAGYSVAVVRITPDVVTLHGGAAALDRAGGYVETEPLDVHNVREDTARTVRLRVPAGLSVVGGPDVHVELQAHAN